MNRFLIVALILPFIGCSEIQQKQHHQEHLIGLRMAASAHSEVTCFAGNTELATGFLTAVTDKGQSFDLTIYSEDGIEMAVSLPEQTGRCLLTKFRDQKN